MGILIFMPHINHMPRTFSPSLTGSSNDVVVKNKMETKLHPILFKNRERCTRGIEFGGSVVSFDLKLRCSAVLEMKLMEW